MNTGDSYFWSKYHKWFVELGYPELDIVEYGDGEWAIIQTLNYPVIPDLCKFQVILQGMRNIEPTIGFVQKYVQEIDTRRRAFWDREEDRSRRVEEEHAARERHAAESAARAHTAITHNPELMERIARNGLQEMDLNVLRRRIPNSKF